MDLTTTYASPLGTMVLAARDDALIGLWFAEQKYFGKGLREACEGTSPVLEQTKQWLDAYFAGRPLPELPKLSPRGTAFQRMVWDCLLEIPYGTTVSYGSLAARVAEKLGKSRMSAQAVGGAVGHNPISVLIPCHRVLGKDGSLTGYAGGLDIKESLLRLESAREDRFYRTAGSTAL